MENLTERRIIHSLQDRAEGGQTSLAPPFFKIKSNPNDS
jgi:hypothetical protein